MGIEIDAAPITGGMFTARESLAVAEGLTVEALAESVPLDRLDLLAQVEGHIDAAIRGTVAEARERGASWQQIANALGLSSKQAAQQRYRSRDA